MLRGQKGEKRDPTRLLREEKMRKRIAKELPKVEAELRKVLENYDLEYGRPFLVLGENYLDEMGASQARAPPPRSKTPSGPAHARSGSRSAAANKAGTVKGAPSSQLRSKTPTNFQTIRGNPHASASAKATTSTSKPGASPSRIPARAPLTSTHGNNSPDRKYQTVHAKPDLSKSMGPPRLPPPKMKDLFVPPQHTPVNQRHMEDLERSASIIRQTAPEDPYCDSVRSGHLSRSGYYPSNTGSTSTRSYASSASSSVENHYLEHPPQERYYAHAPPPASRPQSRQISQQSNTSSNGVASVVSGSENWETFDEGGSADEEDATEAYYAKVRAQQARYAGATGGLKRVSPDEWRGDDIKRVRNAWDEQTF